MQDQNLFLDLRALANAHDPEISRIFPVELAPLVLGGEQHDVTVLDGGVAVEARRVSGGYIVRLDVRFVIEGRCMRCLRPFAHEVATSQTEFVPTDPDADDDEVSPFIHDLLVDVQSLAREAVVLAVPQKILCRPECRGLCGGCGRDLNEAECTCVEEHVDPRLEVLRQLKLE